MLIHKGYQGSHFDYLGHSSVNEDKCVFGVKSMTYLGYVVNKEGIHPDPRKLEAIFKYPNPSSVSDIRRFLGMVNQW